MLRKTRVRHPRLTIGLFGLFGSRNFGNEGSLEAMLEFLRHARPQAELFCICGDPMAAAQSYSMPAIPMRAPARCSIWFRGLNFLTLKLARALDEAVHAFRHVRKFHVLVIPGTGILDDYGERPSGVPRSLFIWCLAARACGTKIAFVSVGAGPIRRPLARWLLKSAAGLAQYRSFRDVNSKEFMQSIGVDTRRDPVYPDIAFGLSEPPLEKYRRVQGERLTVGVGLMSYRGWHSDDKTAADIYRRYVEKLATFVAWLLNQGYCVRLLTGNQSDDEVAKDLVRSLRPRSPGGFEDQLRAETIRSLGDVMREVAQTDVVVATRFHNVVCGLKLGKATISIGYAAKNDLLLQDVGMGAYCQHIEQLDVDLLIRHFRRVIADREEHEQAIERVVTMYRKQLALQEAILASAFLPE